MTKVAGLDAGRKFKTMNKLTNFNGYSWLCRWLLPCLLCLSSTAFAAESWRAPVRKVLVAVPSAAPTEVQNIAGVFTRRLQQRCDAEVVRTGTAPLVVNLALKPGIGAEGFTISGDDRGVTVTGNDVPGLLFGVGKLLRISRYDQNGFSVGDWRGTSVPQKPFRGMYWATHYKNTYDVGNQEYLEQYDEDMGLLGYNTIMIWYDLAMYTSFDDPKSVAFLKRLIPILQRAQGVGMQVGLVAASNHGYNGDAPLALRAVGGHAGNKPMEVHARYHICPSIPEGMELILKHQRRYYQHLKDNGIAVSSVILWGIDDGGCSCEQCKPWDSNGYLKSSEKGAALAREMFGSSCKISLSSWGIDFTEAYEIWAKEPPLWLDYVTYAGAPDPDFLRSKLPKNVRQLNFPDICNGERLTVWAPRRGAYGANPVPQIMQDRALACYNSQDGGFPYSEGIWEDLSKALVASFYWAPKVGVYDALKEYVASEFSPEVTDSVEKAVRIMERNSKYSKTFTNSGEFSQFKKNAPKVRNEQRVPADSLEALELMKGADARLPARAKTSWRWRVLYLRALIDAELHRTEGRLEGDALQNAFNELRGIYQFTEEPIYVGVPMQKW